MGFQPDWIFFVALALGTPLIKARVLESCVLERKRKLNANESVLGTLRFRRLSLRFALKKTGGSGLCCSLQASSTALRTLELGRV